MKGPTGVSLGPIADRRHQCQEELFCIGSYRISDPGASYLPGWPYPRAMQLMVESWHASEDMLPGWSMNVQGPSKHAPHVWRTVGCLLQSRIPFQQILYARPYAGETSFKHVMKQRGSGGWSGMLRVMLLVLLVWGDGSRLFVRIRHGES